MAQQKETAVVEKSYLNNVKWLVSITLVLAAGVLYSWYSEDYPLLYRFIAVSLVIGFALFLAGTTPQGKAFIKLMKEARIEVKKVVWPTRQESLVTSGFVVLAVTIFAILLWAIDSVLKILISGILG